MELQVETHIRKVWPPGRLRRWHIEFLNTPGTWHAWTRVGATRKARWLRPSLSQRSRDNPFGPRCGSHHWHIIGFYTCSLHAGHTGDHEAHDTHGRLIEWWRPGSSGTITHG